MGLNFNSCASSFVVHPKNADFDTLPGRIMISALHDAPEDKYYTTAQTATFQNDPFSPPEIVPAQFEDGKKANLMKRFGTVEDISNAVMFYASPLSSYISGTTLYVDGLEHLSADRMSLYNTLKSMM